MLMIKKLIVPLSIIAIGAAVLYGYTHTGGYLTYSSKAIDPTVEFQYPKAWKVESTRGKIENYAQVKVSGPRNAEDTYHPTLVVRETPVGGRFQNAQEMLEFQMAHPFPNTKVLGTSELTLDAASGKRVSLTYTLPPMGVRGRKPLPVDVKMTSVIVQKGDKIYELVFSSEQSLAGGYEKHFERLLKSFRFN